MRKHTKRKVRVLINPLHRIEGMTKVMSHDNGAWTTKWAIANRLALQAVLTGTADKHDVSVLIGVCSIVHAFLEAGLGEQYAAEFTKAHASIQALVQRHSTTGSSALRYDERESIEFLLELHDAMLEEITVDQLESAIKLAQKLVKFEEPTT